MLETQQLTESIFNTIKAYLAGQGLLLQEGKRDEEMRRMKKGNQWHFGMKAHISVSLMGFAKQTLKTIVVDPY